MSDNPWYREGLSFKCTGCGDCCTGAPGYVWLTDADITRFATHFKMDEESFLRRHARYINGRYSLKEMPKTFSCVFLKERACTVYEARPIQCRTFPWWPENVSSPEAWNALSKSCEGVNHQDASITPLSDIASHLS